MTAPLTPGFIALHGNRSEDLAQAVIAWLRRQPLDPLEPEVVLVQSSGIAEWFKMELAQQGGVCAATRVELPGRFLWRTYRQVLGPHAVPRESPLDKLPMTWRLMQVLPGLLASASFAPVQRYLDQPEARRQLQLAQQLADLFDQYQNYRPDWLADWAAGDDALAQADGKRVAVPADQAWQPALWRAVLATLSEAERASTRPQLHLQALAALESGCDFSGRVARRVLVFGISHLPASTLAALAGLSRHSQVMLAVPNPCRHYWGDTIEGRELLRATRRRQVPRDGRDLAPVALEDMHLHAHPLLAAWGRQGRDFIRQLDAFDDAQATLQRFPQARIDFFDETVETAATPLLSRVQQRIRDLEPLQPGATPQVVADDDRSIVFHVAHSRVRELEILHDQLLQLLATPVPGQPPLQPRDIVVMVPDIEPMAPAIRAVFGQFGRHDARHIPFDIADLSARSSSPIVTALEWLLQLPAQRCRISELVDLLEVPAIARRLGIQAGQLPQLTRWMAGAGIRWGLNAAQRAQIGLDACGEQNSAWFGLQRMLLGYAAGALADAPQAAGWAGLEPYDEIGGLDAELAGALAQLLQTLIGWWQHAGTEATPAQWHARGQQLLADLFDATDAADAPVLAALRQALQAWQEACDQAGFTQAVGLHALRHGWLQALETPRLEQRFRAGGVTFCTLMPMRALPFQVVCLLGMNDGDYPRRSPRSDFDLMALPGQTRPGDRSRQMDDRQLMLEALLSARRTLYIGWTGQSIRDNSAQPPSVLVSQLRDYLAAVWGQACVDARTTQHPLQPFSRRYFEAGSPLRTYAREWRRVHVPDDTSDRPPTEAGPAQTKPWIPASAGMTDPMPSVEPANDVPDTAPPLTLQRLTRFFRNPAKAFLREQLGVVFAEAEAEADDAEAFTVAGLAHYQLIQNQVQHWPVSADADALQSQIARDGARLQRAGLLPLQGFGALTRQQLQATLQRMAQAWCAVGAAYPAACERVAIDCTQAGLLLRDWIDPVQSDGATPLWLQLNPSKLLDDKGQPRPDKLLEAWLRALALAASPDEAARALHGCVVAQDATLRIRPIGPDAATPQLQHLLTVWQQGQSAPLPLPLKTALALVGGGKAQTVFEGSSFDPERAEVRDLCWARCFPDYEALLTPVAPDGQPLLQALASSVYRPLLNWIAAHVSVQPHDELPDQGATP